MSENKILSADWLNSYPAFVIVKWDGARFSTRFYERIKTINAEVANAPAQIEKIASGVYGCASEQVARLLSNIADGYGAISVLIKVGRPRKKEKK